MRLSLLVLSAFMLLQANSARAEQSLKSGFAGEFLVAMAAERANDWSTAEAALARLALLDHVNDDLRHQRMLLLLNAGAFDEALGVAQSYPIGPEQPHLAFMLQIGAAARSENVAEVRKLLAALDEGTIARFLKPFFGAWLAGRERNFSAASTELDKVEPIGQLRQAASFHKALIAQLLGEPEAARTIYSRLLLERADTRTLLGAHDFYAQNAMQLQQGGLARAARRAGVDPVLQTYLETTPKADSSRLSLSYGFAQVLYELATLLSNEGADDLALPYLRVAQALRPQDGEITLMLADLLGKLKQTDAARALLVPLSTRPDLGGLAALQLALLELNSQSISAAKEQLSDLVQRYPGWSGARSLLGDLAARQRDMVSASNHYSLALESLPEDAAPNLRAQLLQARAQCLQQTGGTTLVEADLKAALELDPENPALLNHLGYMLADRSVELEKAEALLRKALELSPDDAAILDSLGWALHKQGKHTEAIRWLELASELSPYDDTINDHLGDAYWAAGRAREARFQWQRALAYRDSEAVLAVSLDDLLRKLEHGPALRISAERQ